MNYVGDICARLHEPPSWTEAVCRGLKVMRSVIKSQLQRAAECPRLPLRYKQSALKS